MMNNAKPARQRIRRHDSSKVMGHGSYVVIAAITMGDAQRLKEQTEPPELMEGESEEDYKERLAEHEKRVEKLNNIALADVTREWNWVDDEGNPLPQPYQNPDVFDLLSGEEIEFITDRMNGNVKPKKN